MNSSPLQLSRVIKTLCDHQGCLDFQRLHEIMADLPDGDSILLSVLSDDRKVVISRGNLEATGGQIISPDSLVLAKTSLWVCEKKPRTCKCDRLHLCRRYVRGSCSFGDQCHDNHSLSEPYNAELLQKHGLQDLTEKQLFQLLLQNDPNLLPEICVYYNKGYGLGSCQFTTCCEKLHVCQHHFQDECDNSCKKAHEINAQGVRLLVGCSQENMRNLRQIYRNKFIIMSLSGTPGSALPEAGICAQQPSHNNPGSSTGRPSKPTSDADNNDICLWFIRNCCIHKRRCVYVHWTLPYRWQFLESDGKSWRDWTNMEDIEKAYCDPGRDTYQQSPSSLQSSTSPVAQAVNFLSMTYEGSPVRRLSTVSSVSKPPHFILTTQWLWYWEDKTGRWLEFGQGDSDTLASVTSETLEYMYLADRDAEIPFSAGNQQYILHFKGKPGTPQMYQENLKYKTKREVRRRPRFVSAHDVKMVKSAPSPSTSSSTTENFPPNWDKNALPDNGYKLVPLSISVEDYRKIETWFKRTMPQRNINSIQRIQNPVLWSDFQRQKDRMRRRNGGTDVNQLYLFHGTDEFVIEAICQQNFDWSMCGVHGTAYGKGSYFARDASYSDRYVKSTGTNKIMFVALVLVGEYCRGSSDYSRPPRKENSRSFYDSCVDDESDPSIYVIFENQQIYPGYLINYS